MKRYGLIGYPLGHSLSAEYFTRKFSREGRSDCQYKLYELQSIEEINQLLSTVPDLVGFNVTIPYKQAIIRYLDDLSDQARAIGAVNCVKREAGRLVGYNTDAEGFRYALTAFIGTESLERALVLGSGGASKAVQYVLAQLEISYDLVSRDSALGNYTYNDLSDEVIGSHRLIINTSPVGMSPRNDDTPRLPYAFLTPSHYLFDLVYNPTETQFMARGKQQGAHICNGLDMFVRQAECAWAIWNE